MAIFHLAHLSRAGLIKGERESRFIRYSAEYGTMDELIAFLPRDPAAHVASTLDGGIPGLTATRIDPGREVAEYPRAMPPQGSKGEISRCRNFLELRLSPE